MLSSGFEHVILAVERQQIYVLYGTATDIGFLTLR